MAEQQRKTKKQSSRKTDQELDEAPSAQASQDKTKPSPEELKKSLDELLDEVDEVLEENAEAFVKSYVQKGGQ